MSVNHRVSVQGPGFTMEAAYNPERAQDCADMMPLFLKALEASLLSAKAAVPVGNPEKP